MLKPKPVNAICYSGYRDGQRPGSSHPSAAEIKEDLRILEPHWRALRLYDCGPHAERVLEVIEREGFPFQVMLGAYINAELSNPGCPWGGVHSDEQLARNRLENQAELQRLIRLSNRYPELISTVSVGNEATVDWTDHLVPVERVIAYVRQLKRAVRQPVTFCENYVPWQEKLKDLAAEVDFISLHTYPVWEQQAQWQAIAYTEANYQSIAARYPDKPVVITEAGWATSSNGRGIPRENAGEEEQRRYLGQLLEWSRARGVLTYVFEAFDESWKGSDDPDEPEKHWGLYSAGRKPKLAARALEELLAAPA